MRTEPDGNEEAHGRRRKKGGAGRAIVEKDDSVASLDCRKAVDEKCGQCGNGNTTVEKRGNKAGLFARIKGLYRPFKREPLMDSFLFYRLTPFPLTPFPRPRDSDGKLREKDHWEEGLMRAEGGSIDDSQFAPATVLRFRSAKSWFSSK